MFRNKILIRASSPSSSSPFYLIPLSLSFEDLSSSSSIDLIDLEILCCKLSRTHRLACFLYSDDIFVVYQKSQSESAACAVEELVRSIPSINVGVEEQVKSASLIARAVECRLRSIMLDNSWSCVSENSFVQSTFACSEERKHLCAINVRVQAETNDGFVFIVSPDVFWFKRHKISDLANSSMLEKFQNGDIIILEGYGLSRSCTVLPSLYEGHVIGLSKLLPTGEAIDRFEELSMVKHGLALPSNYFINVQIWNGSHINKQWIPAAFVLHGPGLTPSPHTVRASKAMHVLELFVNLVGGWDFFSQGLLKVKAVSSVGARTLLPTWTRATSALKDVAVGESISYTDEFIREKNSSSNYLQYALDFHTPKAAWGYISTSGQKHTNVLAATTLSRKSFLDSRVKSIHGADVIQIASIEQKIHTESVRVNERNLAAKKHHSAVGFMNEIAIAESAYVSESKVTEKDISTEDDNIKETTGECISINERSVHESNVAEKKLTSVEDRISGVTTAESDLVSESSITEKKHTSYGSCMNGVTIAESDLVSDSNVIEKKHSSSGVRVSESSQVLQKKEEIEAFLQKQHLTVSTKGPHQEISAKKTLNNEKKICEHEMLACLAIMMDELTGSNLAAKCQQHTGERVENPPYLLETPFPSTLLHKEAASESCKKMKTKHSVDTCDVLSKVMDYHIRGALQSLTVPDLKAFLTTKKAKVGGKKEELIQRVTALLA